VCTSTLVGSVSQCVHQYARGVNVHIRSQSVLQVCGLYLREHGLHMLLLLDGIISELEGPYPYQ